MVISTNQFYSDSSLPNSYATPHITPQKRKVKRIETNSNFSKKFAQKFCQVGYSGGPNPLKPDSKCRLSLNSPSPGFSKKETPKSDIRNYFPSPAESSKKQKKYDSPIDEYDIFSPKQIELKKLTTLIEKVDNCNSFDYSIDVQDNSFDKERILCETSKQHSETEEIQLKGIPKSLKNFGNTCYLNSVVQSLFSLNFFIDALNKCFDQFKEKFSELNEAVELKEKLPITCLLIELHDKVKNSPSDELEKYLRGFKAYIGKNVATQFGNNQQQDAEEFFTTILDNLSEEIEKNCSSASFSISNPVSQFFQYKLVLEKLCFNCNHHVSTEYQETTVFHLTLTPDRALQSAFMKFLDNEKCLSTCADCANNHTINKYFQKLPKVLFFQSGRYLSSFEKDSNSIDAPQFIYLPRKYIKTSQLNSPLSTPYKSSLQRSNEIINSEKKPFVKKLHFDELNFEVISNKDIETVFEDKENAEIKNANHGIATNKNSEPENKNNPLPEINNDLSSISEFPIDHSQCEKYQLISIICHIGSDLSIGHYISYVFNFENSKWFKCNDERIREMSYSEVMKETSKTSFCYFYVHTNC